MTNRPLISIIIPTYNQQEIFLRESIESAIKQTYTNIEILISDNHSTNNAPEIISGYAQIDKRIRVIKPQYFLSMVEHFMFAYNNAQGEFICPLSSDDILYPGIIEEHLIPFYSYPELSFCYSMPLFFSSQISEAKWSPDMMDTGFYESAGFLEAYLKRRHCSWGGILFKTQNFMNAGGFSKNYLFTGDVDAIIKLILHGNGVYCINKPLSAIRQWERAEHTNRTPAVLAEVAVIFDNIDKKITNNKFEIDKKLITNAKWVIFSKEVFPIAYFTVFRKRDSAIIEQTAAIIQKNYPKGLFSFIVKNRKNIIGLFFSFSYLGAMKIKKLFHR